MQPESASPVLSKGRATPLPDQLRDLIKARILNGELAAGARLPSEAELMGAFGVSRVTVRQAIALLNEAHLTETANGKGTFVTQPTMSPHLGPPGVMRQMRDLGHAVSGKLLHARIVPAPAEAAQELRVRVGSPVMQLRLFRAVNERPLADALIFASVELGQRMVDAGIKDRDLNEVLATELGLRITRSEVEASAVGADKARARQLECEPGSPLLNVCVTLYDIEDRPVVCSRSHFVGDLMRYRVTSKR